MLKRREVILAKIESAYNTDPTPVATDAVMVEGLAWNNEGARMVERNASRPSLGAQKRLYGGSLRQVSFSCELKGPGAAYSSSVRPEVDVLLRVCALAPTIDTTVGAETATYKPASTGHESCTIYVFRDGKRFIMTGCRGNVEFTTETGNRAMAKFTITGHFTPETDTALITPTFDSTSPPTVKGGSFAIGGYAAVISALNFGVNNKIVTPPNLNASDGFGEIRIVGRDVAGSFDPEDVLVATKAFISEWMNGTNGILTTGVIGSSQYNRFRIDFPVAYYREVTPGERDEITTFEIAFGATESAGDDEVSLIFS